MQNEYSKIDKIVRFCKIGNELSKINSKSIAVGKYEKRIGNIIVQYFSTPGETTYNFIRFKINDFGEEYIFSITYRDDDDASEDLANEYSRININEGLLFVTCKEYSTETIQISSRDPQMDHPAVIVDFYDIGILESQIFQYSTIYDLFYDAEECCELVKGLENLYPKKGYEYYISGIDIIEQLKINEEMFSLIFSFIEDLSSGLEVQYYKGNI